MLMGLTTSIHNLSISGVHHAFTFHACLLLNPSISAEICHCTIEQRQLDYKDVILNGQCLRYSLMSPTYTTPVQYDLEIECFKKKF